MDIMAILQRKVLHDTVEQVQEVATSKMGHRQDIAGQPFVLIHPQSRQGAAGRILPLKTRLVLLFCRRITPEATIAVDALPIIMHIPRQLQLTARGPQLPTNIETMIILHDTVVVHTVPHLSRLRVVYHKTLPCFLQERHGQG